MEFGLGIGGLVLVAYALFLIWLTFQNEKIGKQQQNWPPLQNAPKVSICIAFRNEEKNLYTLLQSLTNQDYPTDRLEIILVNDHSEDGGPELINRWISKSKPEIHLFSLPKESLGKKEAIALAASVAVGEWLLFTDADCHPPSGWVTAMIRQAQESKSVLVCGPLHVLAKNTFQQFEALEFASLVAVAASGINLNRPNFCNAANLLIRKTEFLGAQLIRKDLGLPSGDDVFLLHLMHEAGKPISFCQSEKAQVQFEAHQNWRSLEHQRIRWAGKWKTGLKGSNSGLAILVWLFHFFFLIWVGFGLWFSPNSLLPGILVKVASELFFLLPFSGFNKKPNLIGKIFLIQIPYSLFVCYFGLRVLISDRYLWKGRQF